MTEEQQQMHALFTQALIAFEGAAYEAWQALQGTYVNGTVTAQKHYNSKRERVETLRAVLLDAYTALLVIQ